MLKTYFLISTLNIFSVISWRPYRILVYDATYHVQEPTTTDFNLTIDNNDTINYYNNVMKDIKHPIIRMEYLIDSGNGKYDMVLANKTMDLCTFYKNGKQDLILQMLMKMIEKYGEIPKDCPIRKKLYFMQNIKIDTEYLPPVLPEKKGMVSFAFMTKEQGKLKNLYSGTMFFKIENVYKNTRN